MPNFEAFNADGEPIEGVIDPAEVKTLQEQLEETKVKLGKLENKEFNFRKLEQMTDEQKAKLSDNELALKKQQEELEEQQRNFVSSFVGDIKTDLLSELAGDDEELKKKIELNYSRIKDSEKAKSRVEIKELLSDAYSMSVGVKHRNPILTAINSSGTGASKAAPVSSELSSIASKFGLTDEDLKKIK